MPESKPNDSARKSEEKSSEIICRIENLEKENVKAVDYVNHNFSASKWVIGVALVIGTIVAGFAKVDIGNSFTRLEASLNSQKQEINQSIKSQNAEIDDAITGMKDEFDKLAEIYRAEPNLEIIIEDEMPASKTIERYYYYDKENIRFPKFKIRNTGKGTADNIVVKVMVSATLYHAMDYVSPTISRGSDWKIDITGDKEYPYCIYYPVSFKLHPKESKAFYSQIIRLHKRYIDILKRKGSETISDITFNARIFVYHENGEPITADAIIGVKYPTEPDK